MTSQTLSRRSFSKLISVGALGAVPLINGKVAAHESARQPNGLSLFATPSTPNIVRLSSNENPYGPSPAALKAMTDNFSLAWRYPDEYGDMLTEDLAKMHSVSPQEILLGDGSSELLKVCAAAFTSVDKKLVIANPTFGAIARHAEVGNAQVVKVDLTRDYRHDLPRMLAQTRGAGVVYICNPNNPTATVTPKNEMTEFIAKLSPSTVVLVDEAYHHYVDSSDYESVIPLVKTHSNLIVARTFSKIYGMAGLRLGYCVSQAENIKRLKAQQVFDSVNIMAIVAGRASLNDTEHVNQTRKLNSEVIKNVSSELDALGYRYIPSHANFMMIDLSSRCGGSKPCAQEHTVPAVIEAMAKKSVEVGRLFPALPTFMRVTIGTESQMTAFLTAFKEVMGS
ncbi:MAG: hypothetical protein C5B55_11265 [Blastocatellia bacterium]|nr:MAG: hypothetical protein C5B55_11265 [Blastocatellia bacterium]